MCTTKFIFQKELILEKISAPKRDFPDFVEGTTTRIVIGRFDSVNPNTLISTFIYFQIYFIFLKQYQL